MSEPEIRVPLPPDVDSEAQYHDYNSNVIPWSVRLIWVGFWVFTVYYTLKYLIPDMQLSLFPH